MDEIIIIGHKNPDLDSVVAAYTYAYFKNLLDQQKYIPAIEDDVNRLTKWVFEKFESIIPEEVENISDRKVILVDHNDEEQRPEGWEKADILEIVDHHQLSESSHHPGKITILPYGSSATIIGEKLIVAESPVDKNLAGLIVSAILDDTLALRSPATVKADKIVVEHMAEIAQIEDISAFCRKLWSQKDLWSDIDMEDLMEEGRKEYGFGNVKVRISQIETMDNRNIQGKEKEIIKVLNEEIEDSEVDLNIAMISDILRGDCYLLAAGPKRDELPNIFNSNLSNGSFIYLPGVVSRKGQVVPYLREYFERNN